MIEKIMYVNLERRWDRREWIENEFSQKGVPSDIIHRFVARDHRDFADFESICQAINEDGFQSPPYRGVYQTTAFAGCNWSQLRVLREIANGSAVTCVFEDDWCFRYPWDEILNYLAFLTPYRPDIVQLAGTSRAEVLKDLPKTPHEVPGWYKDGVGRHWGVIYTPKGAERMLTFQDERKLPVEVCLKVLGAEVCRSGSDLLIGMPGGKSEVSASLSR